MPAATRGGMLLLSVSTIIGVSTGVANAAAPLGSAPAAATATSSPQVVDTIDDYNSAVAAQGTQQEAAMVNGGLAGAALGVVPGCLVGGAMGLIVPPAEVIAIPAGCLMGAMAGGGFGADFAGNAVVNATEPDVMQKCERAMPEWACQTREQQRLHPNDDTPPMPPISTPIP